MTAHEAQHESKRPNNHMHRSARSAVLIIPEIPLARPVMWSVRCSDSPATLMLQFAQVEKKIHLDKIKLDSSNQKPQNQWLTALKGAKEELRSNWRPDITMTVLGAAFSGSIGYLMSSVKGTIFGVAFGLTVAIWVFAFMLIRHISPKEGLTETDKARATLADPNAGPEASGIPIQPISMIISSDPRTAGEYLYTLVVVGKEDQALEYARKIPDPIKRSEALAYVAQALAKINKSAAANAVVTLAVETENQVYNSGLGRLRPAAVVPITTALVEVGRIGEAIEFANRYKGPPLEISWAWFMVSKGLKCSGNENEAKRTAYVALETVNNMKEPAIQPIALIEAVRLLASLRETDNALKIAREMYDPIPAIIGIAKETYRLGDVDKARKIIDEVLDKARKSGKTEANTQARAMASQSLLMIGDKEKANEIANEAKISMPSTSDSLSRFSLLLMLCKTFSKLGRMPEANEFINEAVSIVRLTDRVDLRATDSIYAARMLFKVGRTGEAIQLLNEALNCAKQIPSDAHTSSAVLSISKTRAKFGDFNSALDIINLCSSSDHKLKAHTAILREFSIHQNNKLENYFEKDEDEKDWPYEEDFSCPHNRAE